MRRIVTVVAVAMQFIFLVSSGWAQPYTRIVSPVPGQTVPGPDVKVQFEAGGFSMAPGGWNLHFKLDDEPFHVQYNGNRAHVFKNVLPGSHTVRMYVADAQHQAIPGTLSTVTFHVAHADGANTVTPGQPLLTWNLPQGEYLGADAVDVTLDFLLENVVLSPGGYQVAYYVDGRRFIVQDHNHRHHIKDLAPGLHRVRIELQDCYGDLVPGTFNSGERVIAISPYSTTRTAPDPDNSYARSPRIESIPGSMTVGGPRPVPAPRVRLTPEERDKQLALTVDKEGEILRMDGTSARVAVPEPLNTGPVDTFVPAETEVREDRGDTPSDTPGNDADLRVPATADDAGEFQVRQGGEPDVAPVDLDTPPASNVQRGSVVVHPDPDAKDEDGAAVVDMTEPDETITTRTTRRRADGSVSRVERTTETLRLADRPGVREADQDTTRTVRVQDSRSTATKSDDGKSTTTESDSVTTTTRRGSDDEESTSSRRRERRQRNANRAENAARNNDDGDKASDPEESEDDESSSSDQE